MQYLQQRVPQNDFNIKQTQQTTTSWHLPGNYLRPTSIYAIHHTYLFICYSILSKNNVLASQKDLHETHAWQTTLVLIFCILCVKYANCRHDLQSDIFSLLYLWFHNSNLVSAWIKQVPLSHSRRKPGVRAFSERTKGRSSLNVEFSAAVATPPITCLPLYPFLTGVGGISKRGVAHSLVHLAQPLQPGIRRHFDIYRTCVSNCFPTHPATLFTSVDPPSPSQQHWCSCTFNGFKSSLQFLF